MSISQLRMNIRNAMVSMTVAEATVFAESFDNDESYESCSYAKEFIRELETESDDPNYCPDGPDHFHSMDMGTLSIQSSGDGTAYIDVNCEHCGRSGCVGHVYDTQSVDW